ncbi:DNA polymerase IV [Fusobacterium perfoetens]|uniref:DNA polymerase IV n=1 Tax=Fusobacterium perfoetens TaxID=852 RepID=UPI0004841841|nr:DNA polymerase IV [Fusobacterium perfoetens]MCI6152297.1 DNA polymerase IV [Fusobacterium perfoetens]MDY3238155.1 DNA polymerase IV [Fusobacterium perfoetens]
MDRVILHYDMDCFYASIEIRDNKKYRGKPLVVAGGVVTTASYEARKFGIHSAMSLFEAKKLCSHLIVVPPDKEKYIKESEKIHNLVLKLTHKIEFIALDEGYIDVTEIIDKYTSKEKFAKLFRERIFKHTKLTCSIGIGYNKLSAKTASDINKPNGQFIFNSQSEFIEYIKDKKIRRLQGIGEKFEKILNKDGYFYVKDIFHLSLKELTTKYGKSRGELLYLSSRGIDYSEVEFDRPTHSVGTENTYSYPLNTEEEFNMKIDEVFEISYERLKEKNFLTKTVTIKVKYSNMRVISKSKTLSLITNDKEQLKIIVNDLFSSLEEKTDIRLLGVSFKNLIEFSSRQLSFKI